VSKAWALDSVSAQGLLGDATVEVGIGLRADGDEGVAQHRDRHEDEGDDAEPGLDLAGDQRAGTVGRMLTHDS
jgi:hypothetical protein